MFEEQNLGIPFEEALESLTERVPNLDLKFFATAVVLQRQTGGDLAEILDKIGTPGSRTIQDLGPGAGPHRRRPAVGHRAVGAAADAVRRACIA